MKEICGVLVFLLTQAALASRDPEVVCSSDPVEAAVSEDVILQCHLEPPLDATDMTVEWSRGSHNQFVHLHQDGKDSPAEQKEHFEGRTSLSHEGLTKGNLSLKLSSVQLSDAGRYRCSFHTEKVHKSCYVNLTVENTNNTQEQHAAFSQDSSIGSYAGIITVIVILIAIFCFVISTVGGVNCVTGKSLISPQVSHFKFAFESVCRETKSLKPWTYLLLTMQTRTQDGCHAYPAFL
ncbi:butyrophilin subfamily 3 member A2-like isoform X2 [Micropterus salmoides]|uniref:butyrophilin subfamily 3 member A2-like isoform X2 n=1 Tax=Micropterus salmoides TaxID=27706 RepID=UPI0018EDB2E9|nr:butyrophilin subfamily 3 member A2-like isoform X2 [Micropterus salmoides]